VTDLTDASVERLRVLLGGNEGDYALRFLRSIYYGSKDLSVNAALLESLRGCDLITGTRERPVLTRGGYLVGNVAKEYCNWLDNNREMPEPRPSPQELSGKDVLDLGCSYGRWLWYFQRHARSVLGIEQQRTYLDLGRILAERAGFQAPPIVVGNIDELSALVGDRRFDLVFSRLVFNHVRIHDVLRQCAKVLRPGGMLWLQVERVEFVRTIVRPSLNPRWLIALVFAAFGVANTAAFNAAGVQMRIRIRGRMHTYHQPVYPSLAAWTRELKSAGFSELQPMPAGALNFAFKTTLASKPGP